MNIMESRKRGERGRWVKVPDPEPYENDHTNSYAAGFADGLGWVMASFHRTVKLVDDMKRGDYDAMLSIVQQAAELFDASGADPQEWLGSHGEHVDAICDIESHPPADGPEAN